MHHIELKSVRLSQVLKFLIGFAPDMHRKLRKVKKLAEKINWRTRLSDSRAGDTNELHVSTFVCLLVLVNWSIGGRVLIL